MAKKLHNLAFSPMILGMHDWMYLCLYIVLVSMFFLNYYNLKIVLMTRKDLNCLRSRSVQTYNSRLWIKSLHICICMHVDKHNNIYIIHIDYSENLCTIVHLQLYNPPTKLCYQSDSFEFLITYIS